MPYTNRVDLMEPDAEDEESPTDFKGISSNLQSDWHVPDPAPMIKRIRATESAAVMRVGELLDSKARNWTGWSQSMGLLFKLLGVHDYVQGNIPCPNETDDPVGTSNWVYNDTYAQMLINSNISTMEKAHTSGCPTAHHMWLKLQSMHDYTNQVGMAAHFRTLFGTKVAEGGNIEEHLMKLKFHWVQIKLFGDANYGISEALFKCIIASSLPESWDQFTNQYLPSQLDEVSKDAKKLVDSQQLIGIIKQEAERRLSRKTGTPTIFPEQFTISQKATDAPVLALAKRIAPPNVGQPSHLLDSQSTPPKKRCKLCQRDGHTTSKCRFIGKSKCGQCGKFGHTTEKCWWRSGGGDASAE